MRLANDVAMRKDLIKSLIVLKQGEIPFNVVDRDMELPLGRKKIITLPGVRRCGKSTIMEITINRLCEAGVPKERILWIGFDDERLRSMKSENLDEVVQAYMELHPEVPISEAHIFFDEIQLIGGWEYFVLRLYKSYCKNIFVCGSNATMLSSELASVLRGYPLEYEVFPLSFREYCRFLNVQIDTDGEQGRARLRSAFEAYNAASSFPEVVLCSSESEKLKMLHAYFDAMMLKDLAEHYRIANTGVVKYFAKRLMANLGKPTSVNAIYNDIKSQGLKVSKDDLYLWAEYLCGIFLFLRVPKYDPSPIRERQSLAKYYCIDSGLRKAVLLPQSDDDGKCLENAVFLHLHRNRQPSDKISYWMGAHECDFVLQRGDRAVLLVQACWDISERATSARELSGLAEASAATGCDRLVIVTKDTETELGIAGKTVTVLPAWKWLLVNPV